MGLFNRSKKNTKHSEPEGLHGAEWQDTRSLGDEDTHGEDDPPAPAFSRLASPGKTQKTSRPVLTVITVAVGLALVGGWVVSHKMEAHEPTLPVVHKEVVKPAGASPQKTLVPLPAVSASRPVMAASMPGIVTQAIAPIDQARQMFLTASQNAVHVASIRPVQPNLFAVAYVVGDKSGQAWVDLDQKVVFIGTAVAPDGTVLTPGSTVASMSATQPGVTPDVASPPPAAVGVAGPGAALSPAVLAILKDHQAGFWEGDPKAAPVWAFVDPDSKTSLAFYQRVRLLIDAHKVRVFWIPVGLKDPQSMPRAAFILAQVGQSKALKQNYDGFAMMQSAGDTPANVVTISMRHRVLLNNTLLTNLGQLATPTALLCSGGSVETLFGPRAIGQVDAASACPPSVLAQTQE